MHKAAAAAALVLAVCLAGCTTYRDQLARGQRAFELNEHDRTLAILRDLEPDLKRLSMPEQAEYTYLRGMTDYRVGYRADARHWLSLTKAYEDNSPGVLPADWKVRVNEALDELNGVVYAEGTQSLTTTRRPDDEVAKDSKTDRPDQSSPELRTKSDGRKAPKKTDTPPAPSSAPSPSPAEK